MNVVGVDTHRLKHSSVGEDAHLRHGHHQWDGMDLDGEARVEALKPRGAYVRAGPRRNRARVPARPGFGRMVYGQALAVM